MDLFNNNLPEANDDLRTICEGSAPFNENDYLDLTSYIENPSQSHSTAYDLPNYDENMFAFDATLASNGEMTDHAGQSPEEPFPEPDGSTVGGNNATSMHPVRNLSVAITDLISHEVLQQFFARFDALEDKIDKFQESQIKGTEEMRREMAGLRQAIRAEVLLEIPSEG